MIFTTAFGSILYC